MNRFITTLTVLTLSVLGAVSTASANPIAITSYDVSNVQASGFGNWNYTYTGTITSLGNGLVNLTGGSGTLNDGIISNSTNNNMLWQNTSATITLHLFGFSNITAIDFYGDAANNVIPGGIGGVNVTIGGTSAAFATTRFGNGDNDLDLSKSALSQIGTSTVTLAGFTGSSFYGYYNIGEIMVLGTAANVPEPASLALLGIGVIGMCIMVRRRLSTTPTPR